MLLLKQIVVLVWKQLLLSLVRAPITTPLRALILPVAFGVFLTYAKNFFIPYAVYGIASSSSPVRSLQDAVSSIGGGRTKVAFVRNNVTGGDIDQIISNLSSIVTEAGKIPVVVDSDMDLLNVCPSSLIGGTACIAALSFHSSPNEPVGSHWNYTLYTDGSLGAHPGVTWNRNDQEIFTLPIQHAVDWAIASFNSTVDSAALPNVREFPYTTQSGPEHQESIRRNYAKALISFLGVGFFIGICGITYQQVGAQASETEVGISKLLETMAPNKRRWQPQVARLASYWIAFVMLYFPGWVIMAVVLKVGVFASTSAGIVIVMHILTGFALASQALFIAAFFKKAQLSGISGILVNLVLAIIAQVFDDQGTGAVAALSFFFPSMNYVYFIIYLARFERHGQAADLSDSAPHSPWNIIGGVFWVFLIVQILVYPVAAALTERALWGTASTQARKEVTDDNVAVELTAFTKVFRQNRFSRSVGRIFGLKPREDVTAVNSLDLQVLKGSILVLLGANGSGKSSTLNSVAGLSTVSSGTVAVSSPGLGYCPQNNVLWSKLTVAEHLHILGVWKAVGKSPTKEERLRLIDECDLGKKVKTAAGALSGGQQRKLQLALCFVSASPVALIDEVSSGIDPLARRKIQDIILAQRLRSKTSVIFTTHFLDEAEAIGDHIAILSKGCLKTSGSVPSLKQSAGGYRIMIQKLPGIPSIPDFDQSKRIETRDEIILEAASPARAVEILTELERLGHKTAIHGPSLEDIFMAVAEEMSLEAVAGASDSSSQDLDEDKDPNNKAFALAKGDVPLNLEAGRPVSSWKQAGYLFHKRWTVFRRNPLPNLIAAVLPLVAGGLVLLFLKNFTRAGCTPDDRVSDSIPDDFGSLASDYTLEILAGPSSAIAPSDFSLITTALGIGSTNASSSSGFNVTGFTKSLQVVNSLDEFNSYLNQHYQNVTPGGLFYGPDNTVTFAYVANQGLAASVVVQNLVDTLATNISITTQYNTFSIPWQANQGKTLQFCIYFGLVMSITPAFFALYPTAERLRKVRQHQYSNGVRPMALWLSYLSFDLIFIVVGVTIAIALFAGVKGGVFFDLGLLWVVLFLYGLVGILVSYAISLVAKSQLAAFAIAAAYGAISLLLYIIAYLVTDTYAPTLFISEYEKYVYFTVALVLPAGSLLRAIFVSLNILSINCRGISEYVAHGNEMLAYGGPITYLIVQAFVVAAFLIWWESGQRFTWLTALLRRRSAEEDRENQYTLEPEIQAELQRAEAATDDGLTVLHLTKKYGSFVAVDDISFGVEKDTIFALLGPNGGGKTSTISTISGDLRPTNGHIAIDNIPLFKNRSVALQRLGLCPQFDALDSLTVTETLQFYAKIRGVKNVKQDVVEIIRAVGLVKFKDRLALTLSGGNKRRLSLAIALLGNPALILLDEPSSGMDIAAKRIMWQTLRRVSAGRSMVLVTHSMEEADALANRAGVLAKRFLAFGTSAELRERHGNRYYIHLVLKSAPYSSAEEVEATKDWVLRTFEGAVVEDRMGHGQLRFTVPAGSSSREPPSRNSTLASSAPSSMHGEQEKDSSVVIQAGERDVTPASSIAPSPSPLRATSTGTGIAHVFSTLESAKHGSSSPPQIPTLPSQETQEANATNAPSGFEYSIAQTTLDQVFLNVVQKHNVEEEESHLYNVRTNGSSAVGAGGGANGGGEGVKKRRGWFGRRKGGGKSE